MAEIRSISAVMTRWDWTALGYERGFPRGCQFSDIDAVVEFGGRVLVVETKRHDGFGEFPKLSRGQELLHRALTKRGIKVIVLFGDSSRNDPQGLLDSTTGRCADWRRLRIEERRLQLKFVIDEHMSVERQAPGWEG